MRRHACVGVGLRCAADCASGRRCCALRVRVRTRVALVDGLGGEEERIAVHGGGKGERWEGWLANSGRTKPNLSDEKKRPSHSTTDTTSIQDEVII